MFVSGGNNTEEKNGQLPLPATLAIVNVRQRKPILKKKKQMPEWAFSLTTKNITRSFSMTYDRKKLNRKLFLKTNILAITVNPSARIILAPFPFAIFREGLEYSFIIFSFRARDSFPEEIF